MGTISQQEFEGNVAEIVQLSTQLKERWEIWSQVTGSPEPTLIRRNVSRLLPLSSEGSACKAETLLSPNLASQRSTHSRMCENNSEAEQEEDDMDVERMEEGSIGMCRDDDACESCQFEYHIIYSHSYSVPVLYFTACKSDGRLLSLDEVWGMVPPPYQDRLKHEKWTFITQQEHPYLGRPFFQLHPCHTADLMKAALVSETSRNYVVTWLSSVGPVVGLILPLAFASLCQAR